MLSTIDNPYDPFDQFTSWYLFDVEKGYNTSSYLARIAKLSNSLSQKEEDLEIERAIDRMVFDYTEVLYDIHYASMKKIVDNITEETKKNDSSEI